VKASRSNRPITSPRIVTEKPVRELPDWRIEVTIGFLLLLNAMPFGYAPEGPWNDAAFSRGVGGLLGMILIYRGWYLYTFQERGLVPELRLWKHPEASTRRVAIAGLITLVIAWFIGNPLHEWVPRPAGLLFTLLGLLILLVAGYAALSLGPLADDKTDQQSSEE